jgi:thermitase
MRRSLFALAAAAAALIPATAAQAAEGDIIVQREPGLDRSEQRELRRDAGVKLVTELSLDRTEVVEPKDGDVAEALAELRADENVVYAEPDVTMHIAAAAPNDNYWNLLWGLSAPSDADIDAPEAWDTSFGDGVTVAVVDTGITADHEDLAGQITGNPGEIPGNALDDDGNGYTDDTAGWDFVAPGDNDPDDTHVDDDGYPVGHGTHVSGTIAAIRDNNKGVAGVAPKAKILPLRALDEHGDGDVSEIADAFDYAGELGVPIVNASLGGGYSTTIRNAIAAHPDTLYVVAAGNDAKNADTYAGAYPCALTLDNVLCVGSSNSSDLRSGFSNYGLRSVDLFAPGSSIVSTTNDPMYPYASLSGTSMASPHVAGAAALALAARPGATAPELKAAIEVSVDAKPALSGLSVTGGRLNADNAVAAINGPLPTPTPTPTATPTPPVVTPPPVDPPAPVLPPAPTPVPGPTLSNVTVGGTLLTKRGKLKVRFTLSQPATVRFKITKRGSKRALSAWTKKARAGANSLTITRRLPTGQLLKRGSYTLSVSLNATASNSRSIRVG